jgi:hypothetical protein
MLAFYVMIFKLSYNKIGQLALKLRRGAEWKHGYYDDVELLTIIIQHKEDYNNRSAS